MKGSCEGHGTCRERHLSDQRDPWHNFITIELSIKSSIQEVDRIVVQVLS